jgi:hypothetical protein
MNRRNFFATATAAMAWLDLPRLAAGQSTAQATRGPASPKGTDVPTPADLRELKPGDKAPVSGFYEVIHDKLDGEDHALPHLVTALAGTTFPPCRVCRGEVRFSLHRAAENVKTDAYFRQ